MSGDFVKGQRGWVKKAKQMISKHGFARTYKHREISITAY